MRRRGLVFAVEIKENNEERKKEEKVSFLGTVVDVGGNSSRLCAFEARWEPHE